MLAKYLLSRQACRILPGSHEAVNLVIKGLNVTLDLQTLLPALDSLLILILRRQHQEGNGDLGSIAGVNHRGVSCDSGLELGALSGGEVGNL